MTFLALRQEQAEIVVNVATISYVRPAESQQRTEIGLVGGSRLVVTERYGDVLLWLASIIGLESIRYPDHD